MSDCFWEGFEAFKAGRGIDDNPYNEDTEEYENWQEGWLSGDMDNNLNGEDDLRPW